jgi:hypothetical protein
VLDRDGAIEHYVAITEGRTPRDVLAAYVDGVLELPKWLADHGGRTEWVPIGHPPFPRRYAGTAYRNRPHSDAIGERYRVRQDGVSHGGTSLWQLLHGGVERRGIDVRLRTPATRLLTDGARVTGVIAAGPDRPEEVTARAGVVLTTAASVIRSNCSASGWARRFPPTGRRAVTTDPGSGWRSRRGRVCGT